MQIDSNISFDYDLFLSHNRADKLWVKELAERIEREQWQGRPFRVFLDEWDIGPGQNIPIALERALSKSRKIGLVISPESIQSAWDDMERAVAIALDPAGRHNRLIPLFLRGTESTLPSLLIPLKYIDFRDPSKTNEKLLELLCALREESVPRRASNAEVPNLHGFLSPTLRKVMLSDAKGRCSICHTSHGVDLFPMNQRQPSWQASYKEVIPLCGSCYLRAQQDAIPAHQLESVKETWLDMCRDAYSPDGIQSSTDDLFTEANRLSLTANDIWGIMRARVMCEEILDRYNPFHFDAKVLHEKLLKIEDNMERQARKKDLRLYSEIFEVLTKKYFWVYLIISATILALLASGTAEWGLSKVGFTLAKWKLVLCLSVVFTILGRLRKDVLACVMFPLTFLMGGFVHEAGHITGIYLGGAIRNRYGKRIPFLRCFHYLEVNELPFWKGVKVAFSRARSHGELPNLSVNMTKMQREWYGYGK